jgi:hypothetical protein
VIPKVEEVVVCMGVEEDMVEGRVMEVVDMVEDQAMEVVDMVVIEWVVREVIWVAVVVVYNMAHLPGMGVEGAMGANRAMVGGLDMVSQDMVVEEVMVVVEAAPQDMEEEDFLVVLAGVEVGMEVLLWVGAAMGALI